MSWQIESEHIDLARMEHVTRYVNHAVKSRDGLPAQHVDIVLLGGEGASLEDDGRLIHGDKEHDPKARRKEMLDKLNSLHERGHKYARLHGVKVLT